VSFHAARLKASADHIAWWRWQAASPARWTQLASPKLSARRKTAVPSRPQPLGSAPRCFGERRSTSINSSIRPGAQPLLIPRLLAFFRLDVGTLRTLCARAAIQREVRRAEQ